MADLTDFNQIFPSGVRANSGADYLNSRKMTEQNIRNIINSITDNNSFVISEEFPSDDNTPFEFVVDGYYFSVLRSVIASDFDNGIPTSGSVYANIELSYAYDSTENYSEILSISFSNSSSTTDATNFSLKILKDNEIPDSSKVRFKQRSVDIDEIAQTIVEGIEIINGNA